MEIQIPSPSVFLRKSPIADPPPPQPAKKTSGKAQVNGVTKNASKATGGVATVQDGGISKPKQSKSRNGCMTCKKKRLKCDETKPSCTQCQKRNVECEGYKKDYKWRTFEETTFVTKPSTKPKKHTSSNSFNAPSVKNNGKLHDQLLSGLSDELKSNPTNWSPTLDSAFESAVHAFQGSSSPDKDAKNSTPPFTGLKTDYNHEIARDAHSTPLLPDISENFNSSQVSNTTATTPNNDNGSSNSSASTFSSGSPQLLDLLLPGTDLNQPPDPSELRPPMSPLPYQPGSMDGESFIDPTMPMDEDFDEEITREPFSLASLTDSSNLGSWSLRQASPTFSDASTSSSKTSNLTVFAQPRLDASSPEMLMLRFDKHTCGILSVKDGPTENPWRTLIWPLAQDSPALYHAISSMTAFHGAYEIPNLHVPGMAHMTKSIKKLAFEIENMRLDSALATSLALAFGEGWDRHVSTGIQHLRGAKVMVNNAMIKHRRDMQLGQLSSQDAMRLKFLCNTFIYMDVIARLTSLEEASELDFQEVLTTVNVQNGDQMEIDPLMGCATTLFPVIGRVANLIQKVRRTDTNGLPLVSQAMELKEQLQQWRIPSSMLFERPEDPSSEVQHSIQTAEAYRYATLLYLHQAVPEIPSEPASVLAKKVLMTLASVPLSSRAIIVQIFPLFAASCEVTSQEDRNWVAQRWAAMIIRLKIGNVDSCWKVVQEVWDRRDTFEAEKADRLIRRYTSRGVPMGNFVPPVLNGNKRKARTADSANEETFLGDAFGISNDMSNQDARSPKRRLTGDTLSAAAAVPMMGSILNDSQGPAGFRRVSDALLDHSEPGYTIRGKLHWLGVMEDWQWEVFLG